MAAGANSRLCPIFRLCHFQQSHTLVPTHSLTQQFALPTDPWPNHQLNTRTSPPSPPVNTKTYYFLHIFFIITSHSLTNSSLHLSPIPNMSHHRVFLVCTCFCLSSATHFHPYALTNSPSISIYKFSILLTSFFFSPWSPRGSSEQAGREECYTGTRVQTTDPPS